MFIKNSQLDFYSRKFAGIASCSRVLPATLHASNSKPDYFLGIKHIASSTTIAQVGGGNLWQCNRRHSR